jgi:sec-independent protein translocase protein TatB
MFDIAWSEMVVIGAVALIAIGPKDLPKALRAVGAMTAKARRMAAEFQEHFREAMREAELESVKQEVANIHQDLSAATTGLQSDFNSIGAQLPSTSEAVLQPGPTSGDGEPRPPTASASLSEPAAAEHGRANESSPPASPVNVSKSEAAAPPGPEAVAKLSVEATPAAVIVTETAATTAADKPVRKRRAASKAKARSDAPRQAGLDIEPNQSPSEARTKPRKRGAKPLPSGDDQTA